MHMKTSTICRPICSCLLVLSCEAETRLFCENNFNNLAADILAPCIARPSTAMVLTMHVKQVLVSHKEGFQLPILFQCSETIENANTFLCSPNKFSVIKVYINGLMQERRNSIANALELLLSCTNPSIWSIAEPCGTLATLVPAHIPVAVLCAAMRKKCPV